MDPGKFYALSSAWLSAAGWGSGVRPQSPLGWRYAWGWLRRWSLHTRSADSRLHLQGLPGVGRGCQGGTTLAPGRCLAGASALGAAAWGWARDGRRGCSLTGSCRWDEGRSQEPRGSWGWRSADQWLWTLSKPILSPRSIHVVGSLGWRMGNCGAEAETLVQRVGLWTDKIRGGKKKAPDQQALLLGAGSRIQPPPGIHTQAHLCS